MADHFHYPPEVFNHLVDAIPLLCRAKKDVLVFFQGAGVDAQDLAEASRKVNTDPASINKYEIARKVLTKANARADSGLRARREIIKRVTRGDNYASCWPNDQLKARGLVAGLKDIHAVKASFARMKQERDADREEARALIR